MFSGFPDAHERVWPLTRFFPVLFLKTAIFGDFLKGKVYHASRTTKFAPVISLDSSEFSSEFSDLGTFTSNVKVNPVIS